MMGSLQLPVNVAPEDLIPSSGLCMYLCVHNKYLPTHFSFYHHCGQPSSCLGHQVTPPAIPAHPNADGQLHGSWKPQLRNKRSHVIGSFLGGPSVNSPHSALVFLPSLPPRVSYWSLSRGLLCLSSGPLHRLSPLPRTHVSSVLHPTLCQHLRSASLSSGTNGGPLSGACGVSVSLPHGQSPSLGCEHQTGRAM